MSSNKATSSLAELIKPGLELFPPETPNVLTAEQVEAEIQNREALDLSLAFDRQHSLDQMFPLRTSGPLYVAAPVVAYDF
jgi:hypothetical protein